MEKKGRESAQNGGGPLQPTEEPQGVFNLDNKRCSFYAAYVQSVRLKLVIFFLAFTHVRLLNSFLCYFFSPRLVLSNFVVKVYWYFLNV